ncbi:TorD/DmsD family molecular chaperone [Providencia huaxiensis]|uniref:TorD/DmsD family molecular chaperone n=1 Tax=Providencia huaxiensis TaxID=2027290 RepID=UPI0032DA87CE
MRNDQSIITDTQLQLEPSETVVTLKLLYQLFFFEPNAILLKEVCSSGILLYWQEKLGNDCSVLENYLFDENVLDKLQADHLSLFVGIGMPLAPPWGSVYLDEENLLFRSSTYQWIAFLEEHKFRYILDEKQPQDHIGLMLSVLATLWQKIMDPNLKGEDKEYYKHATRIVLYEHLLTWEERFCQLVYQNTKTPVYRLAGEITHIVVNMLARELQVQRTMTKLFF